MHAILKLLGDVICAPLSFLPPVLAILVLAVLVAAGSLVVFKWTSDQEEIRRSKGPIKGHLLGIFLFRHDLRLVFRSLFAALGRSLANLRFLALPMAVMLVPLIVVFVQMELRLGSTGIVPGTTAVLRVHLRPGADQGAVAVEAPAGVTVDSPGVRIRDRARDLYEVDFRLRAVTPGSFDVVVRSGSESEVKRVAVGEPGGIISPVRTSSGLEAFFVQPGEPLLRGDGDVTRIELAYPAASYPLLGIDWAWWVLFLLFMIVGLYLLRGPLRVDF